MPAGDLCRRDHRQHHQGRDRRIPTIRIETATVVAASTGEDDR